MRDKCNDFHHIEDNPEERNDTSKDKRETSVIKDTILGISYRNLPDRCLCPGVELIIDNAYVRIYKIAGNMFPVGSNVSIATDLCWNREDWSMSGMDLTALYEIQQRSFLPYLSAYHPYSNFPMASSYQSYFRFRHYFRSQLTIDPHSAFNYYECLDAKNLYASLFFGKYRTCNSRELRPNGK